MKTSNNNKNKSTGNIKTDSITLNDLSSQERLLENDTARLWQHWRWGIVFAVVSVVLLTLWSYLNFLCATVQISENQDANWLLNLFYGDRCKRSSGVANLPNASEKNPQQLSLSGSSLFLTDGGSVDLTNLVGPTGPQGPAGANGTNSGLNGTNGTNGINGVNGAAGPIGPAGPNVVTNVLTLNQATGATTTVNGVSGNQTINNATPTNLIGFDGGGNPVYDSVGNILAVNTTNTLVNNGVNTLTSTVNSVASADNIINTNVLTWTQAGGISTSVNGVSANQAIPSGAAVELVSYDAGGNVVFQDVATLFASNAITSINGQTGPAFTVSGAGPVSVTTGVNTASIDLSPCAANESYVYSGAAWACTPALLVAQNGTSITGNAVELGGLLGSAGAATLLNNREIPTAGFDTIFSGTGRIGLGVPSIPAIGGAGPGQVFISENNLTGTFISTRYENPAADDTGLKVFSNTNAIVARFGFYPGFAGNYGLAVADQGDMIVGVANGAGRTRFMSGGNEFMYLSPTGELGIGDAYALYTPTARLHMQGGTTGVTGTAGLRMDGVAANPSLSTANSGRIYFDSTLDRFQCSENAGAYFACFGGAAPIVSANNGLTINPANNVQLGGALTQNTTITNNGFDLIVSGTGNASGKVATFVGDVDITGTIDPERILFSDGVGSYNPIAANGYNLGITGATQRPIFVTPLTDASRVFEVRNAANTGTILSVDTLNNAGRVGIGTTAPTASLDVVSGLGIIAPADRRFVKLRALDGDNRVYQQFDGGTAGGVVTIGTTRGYPATWFVYDDTIGAFQQILRPDGSWAFTENLGGQGLFDINNTSKRLRFNTSSTAASTMFSQTANADTAMRLDKTTNDAVGAEIELVKTRGTQAVPTGSLAGDQLGALTFNTFNGGGIVEGARIDSNAINNAALNSAANLKFYTNDGVSLQERMRIDENGRVGIGDTSPDFKLELEGTSSVTDRKIGINDVQVVYLPDQAVTAFDHSLFIGNGGTALSHVAGEDGHSNTGVGIGSLTSVSAGFGNTATGAFSLESNTTGSYNSAFGREALRFNTTGINNVAVGPRALTTNNGSNNTAVGYESMIINTTGTSNTAAGINSLRNNNGNFNSAFGDAALITNTTGNSNSAFGLNTLNANLSGSFNTALGNSSLLLNSTGSFNTAVGALALLNVNTGAGTGNNTAIGYNTGGGITTGTNNTILGANVGGLAPGLSNNIIIADGSGNRRINVDSSGNVGIGNTTPGFALHVGSAAVASGTTVTRFENAGGTCDVTPNIAGGVTCTSDITLKKNIEANKQGLAELLAIGTIKYNMLADTEGTQKQIGFSAQELESILPSLVSTDANGNKSVSYAGLTPILTKGIQELDAKYLAKTTKLEADVLALQAHTNTDSVAKVTLSGGIVSGDVEFEGLVTFAALTTFKGKAVFNSDVSFMGHLAVGGDTAGTAVVKAGTIKVHVNFAKPYTSKPKITLTQSGINKVEYGTSNVSTAGFDVLIDSAQAKDISFDWTALE